MAKPLRVCGFLVWLDVDGRDAPRLGPRELAARIGEYLKTYSAKRPRF